MSESSQAVVPECTDLSSKQTAVQDGQSTGAKPEKTSPAPVKSEVEFGGQNDTSKDDMSDEFPCSFCFYTAKTSRGLKLHMSFKHEGEKNNLQCPHCEILFDKKEYLDSHVEKCSGVHDFHCTQCNHSFKSGKGLKIHISQKHSVKCPHCDRVCDSPQLLEIHIEQCPHFRAFQCDFCTYTFKTDKGLKSHMSRKHGDQLLNVKCPHCQAFFEHARLLDIHMRVYHGKNFSCMKCKEQFVSPRLLRQHMEDSHSNPLCLYCGIEFEHKKLMLIHMNAHHKDKLMAENGLESHDGENTVPDSDVKKEGTEKTSTPTPPVEKARSIQTGVICKARPSSSIVHVTQSVSTPIPVSVISTPRSLNPVPATKPVYSILKGTSTPPKTSSPKAVTFSQETKTVTISETPLIDQPEDECVSPPPETSSPSTKPPASTQADTNSKTSSETDSLKLTIHCPECRQKFTNPDLFRMHYQVYHKVPTCKDCGLKFDHINLMRIHYNYCHNSANDILYCHHCDKSFPNKKGLLDHLVEQHNSDGKTTAELAEEAMNIGKRDEETGKGDPEVDVVIKIETNEEVMEDEEFEGTQRLENRTATGQKTQEEDGRPINVVSKVVVEAKPQCPECNMIFEHMNLLKIHLKSYHSESLQMSCHNCSKIFTTRAKYLDHLIAAQNNSGQCEPNSAKAKLKNAIVSKTRNANDPRPEPKKRGRKPKALTFKDYSNTSPLATYTPIHVESVRPPSEDIVTVQAAPPPPEGSYTKVGNVRRRRRSIAKIAQQKRAKMAMTNVPVVKRGRKRSAAGAGVSTKKKSKDDHAADEDENNLKCQHCGVKFEHANLLKIHIKAYHNSTTQMLNCNRCGVKFSNKSEYLNHLIMHGAESQSEESPGLSDEPGGQEEEREEGHVTSISVFLEGSADGGQERRGGKSDEDLCRVTKLIENAANNFSDVLKPLDGLKTAKAPPVKQPKPRGRRKIIVKPNTKYPCVHCDQVFDHIKLLTIHTKAFHFTGSRLVCYHCDLSFDDKQDFLNHIVCHASDKYYQPAGRGVVNDLVSLADLSADSGDGEKMDASQNSSEDDDTDDISLTIDNDEQEERQEEQPEDADVEETDLSIYSDANPPGRLPCPICGKSFLSRRRLEVHMFNHAATDSKGHYLCSVCDKSFENPRKLETHFRCHSGYKPYTCADCGKTFSYHSSYHYHKLTHAEDRPCKCPLCGKGFIQIRYLRSHLRSHKVGPSEKAANTADFDESSPGHSGMEQGEISRDAGPGSEDTESSASETLHMIKQEPQDDEEYPQEECAQDQHGEKKSCPICYQEFMTLSELQSHIMCHVGERPYHCQYCTKSFTAYSSWYIHTRTHTGNKPHVCQYCGKRFLHPTGLKRHIRYHTGERPYSCTHCPSAFADSGALVSHMRSHTGSKPFQCKECGRSYTQRSSLKFHMQSHHVLNMLTTKDEEMGNQTDFPTVIVHAEESVPEQG